MADVSSRDLRDHTAAVLRRLEAGERVRVNVNRRPVAGTRTAPATAMDQRRCDRARARIHDTWIAATGLVHGAELWTQDSDFTAFTAVGVVHV